METHQRLAPCPAALEDRKLGPSTGMEEEIEDRGGRDRDQEGGGLYNFSHLVIFFFFFVCVSLWNFTYSTLVACWLTFQFISFFYLRKNNPDRPDGTFPKFGGVILHIHPVKGPLKVFKKERTKFAKKKKKNPR